MSRRDVLLAFAAALTVLDVAVALAPGLPTGLRILISLPAVFVAPGYVLLALLWPALVWAREVIAVLTLASSIAILVLTGLVVAALPIGLTAAHTSVALAIFTVATAITAGFRRSKPVERSSKTAFDGRQLRGAVVLAAAVVIAIAAVVVARRGAEDASHQANFSQLYLVASHGPTVVVGVRSFDAARINFRLVVSTSSTKPRVLKTLHFGLDDDQSKVLRIGLPTGVSQASVLVRLYRGESKTAYRTVGG